jgi:hypothetical protein
MVQTDEDRSQDNPLGRMSDKPWSHALDYLAAGWAPLWFKPRTKAPPPTNRIGRHPDPSREELEHLARSLSPHGNIGVRLPEGVVGVDVDHYGSKRGGETLVDLEAQLGPLPDTVISTSRDGVSGIRPYRVPVGLKWPSKAGPDIEIIHHRNRYVVVWPSTHPEGRGYVWRGRVNGHLPTVAELPDLPAAWVEHLTGGELDDGPEGRKDDVTEAELAAILTEGQPCQAVVRSLAKYATRVGQGAHHDAMVQTVLDLVRNGEQGHAGVAEAVEQLREQFTDDVAGDRHGAEWPEFQRALDSAPGIVLDNPTPEGDRGCCGSALEGQPGMVLPTSFYDERPALARIRDYAHEREAPADPVLYATLARLSAMVPHWLRLETGMLEPLSLNLFAAAVGMSGQGKSSSASVSRRLFQAPPGMDILDPVPPGSGEGMAECYFGFIPDPDVPLNKDGTPSQAKRSKIKVQVRSNAFFVIPEGQALSQMMGRDGATLGATLRSMLFGETAGQQNADPARRRVLQEGTYSIGLLVGFQPATALPLFRDEEIHAGTPQRFVWCWTHDDPYFNEDPVQDGGSPVAPVTFDPAADHPTTMFLELAPAIRAEIKRDHRAKMSGRVQVAELDAHANVTRLKLAALLALLDSRDHVTEDDWRLSEVMWETSCRVRDAVVQYGQGEQGRKDTHARETYARREGAAEAARLAVREESSQVERVALLIAKHVRAMGDTAPGRVRKDKINKRDRDVWDEALDLAQRRGWVEIGEDGRLRPGVNVPAELVAA